MYVAYVHDTLTYRATQIESDEDREVCAARAVAWLRNINFPRGAANTVPQVLVGACIAPHKWIGVCTGHEYRALCDSLEGARKLARAFSKSPLPKESPWVHPSKRKTPHK